MLIHFHLFVFGSLTGFNCEICLIMPPPPPNYNAIPIIFVHFLKLKINKNWWDLSPHKASCWSFQHPNSPYQSSITIVTPNICFHWLLSFTLFLVKYKIGCQSVIFCSQLWSSHKWASASKCLWVKDPELCPSVLHPGPIEHMWQLCPSPNYLVDSLSLLWHIPLSSRLSQHSGSEPPTEFRGGFIAAQSNQMPPLWHRQVLTQILFPPLKHLHREMASMITVFWKRN